MNAYIILPIKQKLMQGFTTQLDAFLYWEKKIPDAIFLNQPMGDRNITYTFAQAGNEARKIAKAIKEHNFPPRSHIALLSKNCAHWHMSDLAIMMSGHVSIPLYPTLTADTIHQILVHSEAKLIIAGKLDDYEGQRKGFTDVPQICVGIYDTPGGTKWEDIIKSDKILEEIYVQDPEDLYTIIYTSGTTGNPKGVMHTVGNFMATVYGLNSIFDVKDNCRVFSYLPIAHVAERILENLSFIFGTSVYFPESLITFAADLEKAQPNIFFAVPRIWSKFQEKILEKLPQKKLSLLLSIPFINSIIRKKLQEKLGLRQAEFILTGAAPIDSSLLAWYKSIGIEILQVYGMTEDGCISHCNVSGANKLGTVGKSLPGVKIKFSQEGEIKIHNNCLMKGYYKEDALTDSVFDGEGYLSTGDIGEYDHEGFLTITGRVKDQFKTDKGKYISPAPIELKLSQNTDIGQICIVGTGIPQPIALITLSDIGRNKSKANLSAQLIETMNKINPGLEKHEKIQKIVVMKEDWDLNNGLITPTLKVKRNKIEKIHQPYYRTWFNNEEIVIYE